MDMNHVYKYVQDLFRRGLVIVVGSGASCAYGLPSMGQLATHLLAEVDAQDSSLCEDGRQAWVRVSRALRDQVDLENALGVDALPDSLATLLTATIADCVRAAENKAIAKILADDTISAFGRLLDHCLKASDCTDVITTNYDRLIEVHAARASVRVDTMYYGHTVGRLNEGLSREELLRTHATVRRPPAMQTRHRPHIRLAKPHGSLDWFSHGDEHYRCDLSMPGAQQIIAPGGNKYRLGYEIPFDAQRARANRAIDAASALLFIGYGFNDDHLQTHLYARIPQIPTVVLSRSLTDNAKRHLQLNPAALGIEANTSGGGRLIRGDETVETTASLWDLDALVEEVLDI